MSAEQVEDVAVDSEETSKVFLTEEQVEQEKSQNEQDNQEERLQSELDELKDRFTRMLAEYDNYRKRTAREKESIWQDAISDTILKFIPVYDSLSRAVSTEGDDTNPHKQGLIKIFQQYQEILKSIGVVEIDALGQIFDPEKHNAVNHIEDENYGDNVVSQVFQAGFTMNGKVIRYAIVQVAN